MKKMNWFALAMAPLMMFATVGCDVDVEKSGSLPDVDVSATPGEMPEFDVDGPTITTGTTTVEVPTMDVDLPEEDDDSEMMDKQ